MERVLELAHIATNKNTVPGDVSAMVPGGLRMGSPALTSRGFVEKDFEKVAALVDRGVQIALDLKKKTGPKLKDFRDYLAKEVGGGGGRGRRLCRGGVGVNGNAIRKALTHDFDEGLKQKAVGPGTRTSTTRESVGW